MKLSVLPFLACPASSRGKLCAGALTVSSALPFPERRAEGNADELLEGVLACSRCRTAFPILSGVAVLTPDPEDYLRRFYPSVLRDLKRYGALSGDAQRWLERRPGRNPGTEEYGADFRFSQQFERPADVAEAMTEDPQRLYGSFLHSFGEAGPYDVLAAWAAELPGERHLALDAGCGGGGLVARLARSASHAFGIDLSLLGVLLARRVMLHQPAGERSYLLNVRRGLEVERPLPGPFSPNTEFFVADCCALPFPDGLFDLVTSCNVIDIVGVEGPLNEVARLTRSGGRALVSAPFFWQEGKAPEGEPVGVLQKALAERGLRLEAERDGVPWAWATYDRHWRVYFNYCAAARKAAR
jgi:SAM-dependent methyltransferase